MKKKILYTALTVVFLFSFVGCKKKSDTTTKKPILTTIVPKSSTEEKYTVRFDSNGGSSVTSQEIKKGSKITKPTNPTYDGFDFIGWYIGETLVDFDTYTVSGDVELKAQWSVAKYQLSISKNIEIAGNVSGENKYERDALVTVSAEVTNGNYLFDGWYLDDNLVSEELSYTFTMPKSALTIEARFKDDFIYDSSDNTKMVGLKDKSVTSLYIPDTVKSIEIGALSGCSNLESLTIPFVGLKEYSPTDLNQYPFGVIFGESSYEGVENYTTQYYYNSENKPVLVKYYIPESLKEITLTGSSFIQYGGFRSLKNVTKITIPESIKVLSKAAFLDCDNITEITIPDSIELIGGNAFDSCDNLKRVKISSGDGTNNETIIEDYAFVWCANLEEVEFPSNTVSIGKASFYYCTSLKDIIIPSSVSYLGNSLFEGCTCDIVWEDNPNATTIEKSTFSLYEGTSIKIPSSITTIGEKAFFDCPNLTTVTMGKNITSIENSAFSKCEKLTSLDLGNSLVSVGEKVFSNCKALTSLTLPNTLKSIGKYAFEYCTCEIKWQNNPTIETIGEGAFFDYKGTSLIIPNSVITIGHGALRCPNLTTVVLGSSITSLEEYAFTGCSKLKNVYYNGVSGNWCTITFGNLEANPMWCSQKLFVFDNNGDVSYNGNKYSLLAELVIPENVTSISAYSFVSCKPITSIVISDSVTSIGNEAFFDCRGISSVILSNNLTTIGDKAFSQCESIKSIIIPISVTNIGEDAFFECYKLEKIFYEGSKSDWSSITIGSSDSIDMDYVYYYSETEPSETGNYWCYDENDNPSIWK